MFRNFILVLTSALGLVWTAQSASATIIYSICTSGCTSTSGSYAATAAQAPTLTFPSPISFTAGSLTNGVYTDPGTGVVITAMNGNSVDTLAFITGTDFRLSVAGTGTGFLFTLPANTLALSFNFTGTSYISGAIGINGTSLNATNYLAQEQSGYISFIGNSAISSIFFGAAGSGGTISLNNFEPGTGGGGGDPNATPEPSSFLLFGSGLIGAVWVRRRRRPQTTPQASHRA